MRWMLALLTVCGIIIAGSATVPLAATTDGGYALALDDQQQPSGRLEVDIDTDRGGGAWYTSPLWIAIGVIALVLLILLIVVASRGGGTTVIRE
jgi:hypothetical protein